MAIGKNGINGSFSGKVGTVIGYELNGQQIMRSVGRRTKPFSELELLNQAKMKVVSEFLGPIKPFIKFGYQREAPPGSRVGAFQLAQSYVRKHAVDLDAQRNPFVNPANVLISRGDILSPQNCTVECEDNRLIFRWDYNGQGGASDHLMILLYDGLWFREFREIGAERRQQTDVFESRALPYRERPIHVYAAFRDTFFDRISDSVYCGAIE